MDAPDDARRCRACRRWCPEDPAVPDAWGECRLAASDAEGDAAVPESLATALAAGDTAGAALLTAPDFGCVQWAPGTWRPC